MAGLWINQCGEVDMTRREFAFSLALTPPGNPTISGDADAKDEYLVNRVYRPSGDFIASPVAGSWIIVLDRELDPGWWLLELVVSGMERHDFNRDTYVSAAFYDYGYFSSSTMEVYTPSEPIVYRTVASDGVTIGEQLSRVGNVVIAPCHRAVVILEYWGSATTGSVSIALTGTWLACPDCPEPI